MGFIGLLAILTFIQGMGCSSSSNSDAISGELENRLTDALGFEGGTVVDGSPPKGETGTEVPGIVRVEAPDEFRLGAPFRILLASDFADPEKVDKAIIHVKKATRHIVVPKRLTPSGDLAMMDLLGRLENLAALKGLDFELEFALQTADGRTGAYRSASSLIPDEEPDCTDGACCNGGSVAAEGAVCRLAAGPCDAEERCDGASTACPEDGFLPADRVCRTSAGVCDPEETCPGDAALCPDDAKRTDICREAAGACDLPEVCDGRSDACPSDEYKSPGDSCDDGLYCTGGDVCDGTGPGDELCSGTLNECNGFGVCEESLQGACVCEAAYDGADCGQCSELALGDYPDCELPLGSQNWATPPTEQAACYSWSDPFEETACPGTAGTGECANTSGCGQDAQYTKPAREFRCLDSDGAELAECPQAAAEGVTVEDLLTGLIWQQTAAPDRSWADAYDACKRVLNENNYGGHADWRLPGMHELSSLSRNLGDGLATLDNTAFPDTSAGAFWSASFVKGRTEDAWVLDFSFGGSDQLARTESAHVRCVRNAPDEATDRFSLEEPVAGEPVVTDRVTGRVWQVAVGTDMDWVSALSHCEASGYAGEEDWRLPDKHELRALIDFHRAEPASDFPELSPATYWTSTTYVYGPGWAWSVDFGAGRVAYIDKSEIAAALCVR